MPTGVYLRTAEMYKTRRGRRLSDQHKQKISRSLTGVKRPGRGKGKKLSEEHKTKIRKARLGYKPTPETLKKLRDSHRGKKWTPEQREKITLALKGGNKTSFRKGQMAWNKGARMPQISNTKNHGWKGTKVSYAGLHAWVRRYRGVPSCCEHCKSTTAKRYEWANRSHEYKRDLSDWIRLCKKCHITYDRQTLQKRP